MNQTSRGKFAGWRLIFLPRMELTLQKEFSFCLAFFLFCAFVGCSPPPQFASNEVQWLKNEKLAGLKEGEHFSEQHKDDVSDILTAWFGTPDEPHFPFIEGEDDAALELIDPQNLYAAAGPVQSDRKNRHKGLYREHCAHCHGITGDGVGPTATFLNPYPRDFRLSRFKFKKTPTGSPPSKEDLKRVLRNGIPGTAMPSFSLLEEKELDALVDYVIYLSIRGSVERGLIDRVRELDESDPRLVSLPEGVRLRDKKVATDDKSNEKSENGDSAGTQETKESESVAKADQEVDEEEVLEQLDILAEDILTPNVEMWLDAQEEASEVPEMPKWVTDKSHSDAKRQLKFGRELYLGKANCVQCHGKTGIGDGQTNTYDDWIDDWVKGAGVDPTDPESFKRFVKAGAFPPRPLLPRNLRLGNYRGGDLPSDMFLRIKNGIEGTPMPASLTLTDDEIWALVLYVREMPYQPIARPETSKVQVEKK